jgi:tripartite-type tricarboxylate transporter receptor subunit TctC
MRFVQHSQLICAAAAMTAFAGLAQAQAYPARPITIIVAFAAGGPVDLESRLYTAKAGEIIGQPMIIEYKVGGGTAVGSGYVAKAKPDGYTLLSNSAALAVFPAFYTNLDFDVLKDLVPVTQMSKRSSVLVASTASPFKTYAEYLAYAKANPSRVNYGTAGVGDISHLVGEWMHSLSGSKVTFVPFKGTGPVMTELMAGRIDVSTGTLIATLPLVKAGKIRPLAMLGSERSKHMPDVPTVAEHGMPEFDYANWLGFFAPGGTPAAVVNKVNDALARVARMPAIVTELDNQGSLAVGNTPAQFRQYFASEVVRWKKVVDGAGIKLTD